MKNFKWAIIGVLVIIVILIVLLIAVPNDKQKETSKETNQQPNVENTISENEKNQINTPPEFSEEPGYREYFTVVNCISKYLNNENSNETIIFVPVNVVRKKPTRIDTYLVSGITASIDIEYRSDVNYLVSLDTVNKTFLVRPVTSNDELNDNVEAIENNQNNKFEYENFELQDIYQQIFKNMKRLMLAKPEIAYERLEETYKNKRFGSYENFEQFVNNNRDRILNLQPNKYKVNDDNTLLTIRDQDTIGYQFNITGTMKYTAKIDNYIVLFEDDIERYQTKLSKEEKVEYNITRWFKMLWSKDYKFAYNVLDEEFRNDKFGSQEQFANYISKIYNENNEIVVSKLEEEGNVFVAEVLISDPDDEYSDKYMNVIIRLDEGTDFTMSFEME